MADTLADALPREIRRVTAKKERWAKMASEHPDMAQGLRLSMSIMQATIDAAVSALASDDIVRMLTALADLRDYSDDD